MEGKIAAGNLHFVQFGLVSATVILCHNAIFEQFGEHLLGIVSLPK